jgi:hypothetical protein
VLSLQLHAPFFFFFEHTLQPLQDVLAGQAQVCAAHDGQESRRPPLADFAPLEHLVSALLARKQVCFRPYLCASASVC